MDLKDEIKNLPTGRKEVRSFGITFGVLFFLWGGYLYWRHGSFVAACFIAAFVFPAMGYLAPAILRPVYKLWMALALCLGWVMTRILLTVFYFFMVTPIGMVSRISGKRFLDHGFKEPRTSYWIPKPKRALTPTDYEKQF